MHDNEAERRGTNFSNFIYWLDEVKCCETKLISGLDRVFITGTQPASQAISCFNEKVVLPQYLWYMVSGALGDIVQLIIDYYFLHSLLQINDPSLCWMGSFSASISVRHTTHRYLVFGDYVGGYWNSLLRMYGGYSIILVLSTAFNWVMTHYFSWSHYFGYFVTLFWTGIVNYFLLKFIWKLNLYSRCRTKQEDDDEINDEEAVQGLTAEELPKV
mmetsp:Transcript_37196/g.57131  ORF Transcript_37196/g.57131 Transcript_37196/m.57131 type:complete len:215 (-) Transcript_37196:996-1640(-)